MIALAGALALAACGADLPDDQAAGPLPPPRAPLDTVLARAGHEAFRNRGCMACHQIGEGRLVGPDLAGVTRRRTYPWYAAMVLRPDSMIRNDSTAMALLREYAIPMTDQRASLRQVRSIWEYLRLRDAPPEGSAIP